MDGIIEELSRKPIRQRVDVAVSGRGRQAVSTDINKYLHLYYQMQLACFIIECHQTPAEKDLMDPPTPPVFRTLYSNSDIEQSIFNWGRAVMYLQKFALQDNWLQNTGMQRVLRQLAENQGANEFFDWYIGEPLLAGSALGETVVQIQSHLDNSNGV